MFLLVAVGRRRAWRWAARIAACGAGTLLSSQWFPSPDSGLGSRATCHGQADLGKPRPDLRSYTTQEVREHNSARDGNRIWVTYKAGVYDITDFVKVHPGGEKRIMLAAGGEIDKYWSMYTIHDDEAVRTILEQYRIGNYADYTPREAPQNTIWDNEPLRSPALVTLSARPFNAESPEVALEEFYTSNDLFFVRSHMPVPDLSERRDLCLQVDGDGIVPHCFTVDELRTRFPQHTISAVIQCGGNRRTEMGAAAVSGSGGAPVKGLPWTSGGIGNATWTGVWLRDVLAACEVEPPKAPHTYHVHMEGADKDAVGHFIVSIPYTLATDPQRDVLVALMMNGESIPRDHGYPLRAVVPGVVGVRNCKWLQRVSVLPFEAQSVWQQRDYKNFPSWVTRPIEGLPSVYSMPVQSCITDAQYNPSADAVSLKAYAYSGGGVGIQRVELSTDGGKTFSATVPLLPPPPSAASLQLSQSVSDRRHWSWRLIDASIPLDDIAAEHLVTMEGVKVLPLCIRAVTNENVTQPERAPYNFRGLLFNGYSCRDVAVE